MLSAITFAYSGQKFLDIIQKNNFVIIFWHVRKEKTNVQTFECQQNF